MVQKNIDMILRNEWERYDAKKMMRLKAAVAIAAFIVLWVVFFVMMLSLPIPLFADADRTLIAACVATILTLAVGVYVTVRITQIDRDKRDWYFSGLQDARLRRDDVLALARISLAQHGYTNCREEGSKAHRLGITFFDIPGADFRMRVWYAEGIGPPIAEIGFGPETPINSSAIMRLRADVSAEFARRYGPGRTMQAAF